MIAINSTVKVKLFNVVIYTEEMDRQRRNALEENHEAIKNVFEVSGDHVVPIDLSNQSGSQDEESTDSKERQQGQFDLLKEIGKNITDLKESVDQGGVVPDLSAKLLSNLTSDMFRILQKVETKGETRWLIQLKEIGDRLRK